MRSLLAATVAATLLAATGPSLAAPPAKTLRLEVLGSFASGLFDEGGAEIPAFDPATRRAFVVNAGDGVIDVLDLANPSAPTRVLQLPVRDDLGALGLDAGNANSVAVRGRILAVAIENDDKQEPGWVAFYDTLDLDAPPQVVQVGALPDMVTFSDDGLYVLAANEGEPSDAYDDDPEGSVSIINLAGGVAGATVMTAGFGVYDGQEDALRSQGIRIYGPDASASQDFEPEYIATAGGTAWVTLQENNAVAVVDILSATVLAVVPLGFKDHSLAVNALDRSDRDGKIDIVPASGVLGMYQPDAIAAFSHRGQTFLVTANEGDTREYDTFDERTRAGRLRVTNAPPFDDDNLYSFGARSISIWDAAGTLVWDSGDELERITAAAWPDAFNSTNDDNDSFDDRSDDKGPEPEGVVLGKVEGRTFAFVGLERIGGIVVYDITDPHTPTYVSYVNNRDFSLDAEECTANGAPACDLGPEGLHFVAGEDSPNGRPMLIVGNEISGTTTIYGIEVRPASAQGPKKK
jgi:hypothetical protein